jgi:penicillin-binding protein 1C
MAINKQMTKREQQIVDSKKVKDKKPLTSSSWKEKVTNFIGQKKIKRIIFLFFLLSLASTSIWLFWGIPLPTNLSTKNFPVSTKILDRNGKLIYEIYTDKRRTPVKLSDLPPYIKEATISIEDKDFYKHGGFSYTGIARAVFNIVFKRNLEGGSTLTQQLVKNALLTPERTVKRKIREFALTIFVEAFYKKDDILEMYLNQIPYGSTAYGIEAASELYFNKEAKDLTLGEATLLAGLPQSPTRYSPFGAHPEYAKERQKTVLRRMVEDKYITQEEADKAAAEELTYAKITPPSAPHFALWVKEQLVDKYGENMVEQGGLRVTTTLDLDLQELAQETVATEVAKLKKQHVGNGAAIVTRPASGEILAMVGSKDYFATDEDGKFNVILSKRQPGSSIKPLNYALAIRDKKITPSTPLADVPTCFAVPDQPAYCPTNYDNTFHGLVQVRFTLGNSYNIPAVRVLALNGLANFVDFAKQMGLTTLTDAKDYGLSLTLGGSEVRPIDMAEAYGVFANSGIKQPLISILKVEDWQGKVYEDNKVSDLSGERILDPGVTYLISHILLDNNARSQAFGPSSYLVVKNHPEVSVKTGTTNDRRDNWTIGYTKYIAVVVWVGNNDNSEMSGAVSGVSGASPIWNKVIKAALDKAEKGFYNPDDEGHAWPLEPDDVVGKSVCWTTGGLPPNPDGTGCDTRFEYFLEDNIPSAVAETRQDIFIDKVTGEMDPPDTPQDQVNVQNHPVFTDPLGTLFCLDCTLPTKPVTIRYSRPD